MTHMTRVGHRCICAVVIGLGSAVLGFSGMTQGDERPGDPAPIELQDVEWQFLSDDIESVFVGPDDRIWRHLHHPSAPMDLAEVRRNIEDQFNRESPWLFGSEPVLFETTGRVWFRTTNETMVLGFDGQNWYEHTAVSSERFVGNCPGQGCRNDKGFNLEVDGTLFFPGEYGVHTFDGRQWDYVRVLGTSWTEPHAIAVRAQPQGQGVIALDSSAPLKLWHHRGGRWHPQTLPEGEARTIDVLPGKGNGVWLSMKNDTLEFRPLMVDTTAEHASLADAQPTTIDLRRFTRIRLLHCDSSTGRCFFLAEEPANAGSDPRKYLLTLNGDEGDTAIAGYDGTEQWDTSWFLSSGPVLTRDGRGVWIPGRCNDNGADLLDLSSAAFVDSVPDPAFYWIHGIRRDGTLFVTPHHPTHPSAIVAAYRSGRPPVANTLPIQPARIMLSGGFCIDSHGGAWASLQGEGVCRFDGTQWRPVPELAQCDNVELLLPGENGRVMITCGPKVFYRQDDRMTEYSSLEGLIIGNQADVARMYPALPPAGRSRSTWTTAVVADTSGHIWLLNNETLRVLAFGWWQNVSPVLLARGSRSARIRYVNTIGTREKVYVSDFLPAYSSGTSFFVGVHGGQIVADPAPHCYDEAAMCANVRDDSGALWIPGENRTVIRSVMANCDRTEGQLAFRINQTGVLQEWENQGWPLFCDRSGTVWMGRIWGESETRFNLWRAGGIQEQAEIPTADRCALHLFSDGPGSLYAWTKSGLYRLRASPSGAFMNYRVVEYYMRPVMPGNIATMAYDGNGHIIASTYSNGVPQVRHIVVIPIPSSGQK